MIQVGIVDDEIIVVQGLCSLLKSLKNVHVAFSGKSGEDLLESPALLPLDVLLLDINLKGGRDGIKIAKDVLQRQQNIRIIMLSMLDDPNIIKSLISIGIKGYIIKGNADLYELELAFKRVMAGEFHGDSQVMEIIVTNYNKPTIPSKLSNTAISLTSRNMELIRFLGNGLDNASIGEMMGISAESVTMARHRLFSKLEVKNATEMIVYLLQQGVLDIKTFNDELGTNSNGLTDK